MIFQLTHLSTGEQVEWHAAEGDLIDVIAPWLPLSGNFRRDLPLRRIVYKLQYGLRHGHDTTKHEDALGIAATSTP